MPLDTGPLPATILHKTKDIAGMGKDANLEGCYNNSALPTLFFKPKAWWRPISLQHHSHRWRAVYRDMNGKIDNTP